MTEAKDNPEANADKDNDANIETIRALLRAELEHGEHSLRVRARLQGALDMLSS